MADNVKEKIFKFFRKLRNLYIIRWYNCVLVRGHTVNNKYCPRPSKGEDHETTKTGIEKCNNTRRDIYRFGLIPTICCYDTNHSEMWHLKFKDYRERKNKNGPRLKGAIAYGINGVWNLLIGVWGLGIEAIKVADGTLPWSYFGVELLLFIVLLTHGVLNMIHSIRCFTWDKDKSKDERVDGVNDMTQHNNKGLNWSKVAYSRLLKWSMHHNALCAPISALMSIPVMVSLGIPEYNEDGLRIIYNAIPLYTSFAIYLVMAFLNYFWFAGWMFFSYERMWYTCPNPPPKDKKERETDTTTANVECSVLAGIPEVSVESQYRVLSRVSELVSELSGKPSPLSRGTTRVSFVHPCYSSETSDEAPLSESYDETYLTKDSTQASCHRPAPSSPQSKDDHGLRFFSPYDESDVVLVRPRVDDDSSSMRSLTCLIGTSTESYCRKLGPELGLSYPSPPLPPTVTLPTVEPPAPTESRKDYDRILHGVVSNERDMIADVTGFV